MLKIGDPAFVLPIFDYTIPSICSVCDGSYIKIVGNGCVACQDCDRGVVKGQKVLLMLNPIRVVIKRIQKTETYHDKKTAYTSLNILLMQENCYTRSALFQNGKIEKDKIFDNEHYIKYHFTEESLEKEISRINCKYKGSVQRQTNQS